MIEYLSSSQINLFLQCSLKYKFRYIDKIPITFKSSGMALGSTVHSALSWLHKKRMNGKDVTLDEFLKIFDVDWYSQKIGTEIRYKKGEEETNLVVFAKEILALYFHQPHNGIKGAEIPFAVPIIDPVNKRSLGINLEGFIDLIEEDGTIVEFKTSNQTINQRDVSENIQLTAYSYAYEILHSKPPKTLKVIDFVKTKKPKILTLETNRNERDYQRFFYLTCQISKSINNRLFYPRTSFLCNDCEYKGYCKRWGVN